MATVLKDRIEHKVGDKIKLEANIMQWMIIWAAMLLSRYTVGPYGKKGFERMRGRNA